METEDVESARGTVKTDPDYVATAGNVLTVLTVSQTNGNAGDRVHGAGTGTQERDCGYALWVCIQISLSMSRKKYFVLGIM